MVKNTFNNAIGEMGPLYLFINCAGMAIGGTLEDSSTSDIMVFLIFDLRYNKYLITNYQLPIVIAIDQYKFDIYNPSY